MHEQARSHCNHGICELAEIEGWSVAQSIKVVNLA